MLTISLQQRLFENTVKLQIPPEEIIKLYVLERLLWRVSQFAAAEQMIARGSLITRNWILPAILRGEDFRPVQDLDLMAVYPFDMERGKDFFKKIFSIQSDDGVEIINKNFETIVTWGDTPNPGIRTTLNIALISYIVSIQIDMGFNDPLVPAATWYAYQGLLPENHFSIVVPTPELACAWKLHGLFEFQGIAGKTWKLKDLYDIYLILKYKSLNMDTLSSAIRVAFEDRKTPFKCYKVILENQFGQSNKRLRAWRKLNEKWQNRITHPSHLILLRYIRQFIDPIFMELISETSLEQSNQLN